MTEVSSEYIRYRLERAAGAIRVAGAALQLGEYDDAVNRLYYACYHAVTALLHAEGLSSSKHGDAMALVDRHWVKTGRLPREFSRFFRRMFDRRQEADYPGGGLQGARQDRASRRRGLAD